MGNSNECTVQRALQAHFTVGKAKIATKNKHVCFIPFLLKLIALIRLQMYCALEKHPNYAVTSSFIKDTGAEVVQKSTYIKTEKVVVKSVGCIENK